MLCKPPIFVKILLLFFLGTTLVSCDGNKSADSSQNSDCAKMQILNAPIVIASQPGQYILRWETRSDTSADGCLVLTLPDGSETTPSVSKRPVTVEDDNFFQPYEGSLPYQRHLLQATIDVSNNGKYHWEIDNAAATATGDFVSNRGDTALVALIGDTNTDTKENDIAVTEKLLGQIREAKPDLLVHAGDIVYNVYGETWSHFFATFATTFTQVPILPAIGNHEYEFQGEIDQYSLPYLAGDLSAADGGRVLVSDVGPMRIVTIDSNSYFDERGEFAPAQIDAMWQSVEKALSTAGDKIKAVVFHHPIYTLSKHAVTTELRDKILALDDKYDINFVFTGHNHVYERFVVPDRFHTILAGGGGAFLYELEETNDPDSKKYLAFESKTYSWVKMAVTKTSVKLTAIGLDGTVLESADLDIR